jgi:hypothetical protein
MLMDINSVLVMAYGLPRQAGDWEAGLLAQLDEPAASFLNELEAAPGGICSHKNGRAAVRPFPADEYLPRVA